MKLNARKTIFATVFALTVALVFVLGYKVPPVILKATDISLIDTITVNRNESFKLTEAEIEYWKSLKFKIVEEGSPGATPYYIIDLNKGKTKLFSAMYSEPDKIVFFSFIREIGYGFLNPPGAGGWMQPLYKTDATDELLQLLKVKHSAGTQNIE